MKIDKEKLKEDEIYHLIDLLVMNIRHTPFKILMNDEQKKEAVEFDKKLIATLEKMLDEKTV